MNKSLSKKWEIIYLILIPVGVFLFCVFFDVANNKYWQERLDNATEEIFIEALKSDAIDDVNEYIDFADSRYKLKDLNENDIRITFLHDENNTVIMSNTIEHFSISGYVFRQKKYTTSRYSGYINEYNEPVVEKLIEIYEDDRVEEGNDNGN